MKRKKFDFYAYHGPTSGKFTINGYEYTYGEDFRSVERYREYKSVGFDMLLLRYENAYDGEEWETSATKLSADKAYAAGIRKMLVTDLRIDRFINRGNLLGDGEQYRFHTEEELIKALKEYVAPYKDMPWFYGIQLVDEPSWEKLEAYGYVARALKKILPNAYLQCNLHPMGGAKAPDVEDDKEAYEKYLTTFLDNTGVDGLCCDPYPFRREYIIGGRSVNCFQIMARVCRERNVEFRCVMQAFGNGTQGVYRWRLITEADMYWQINMALGFGCREYSFYTYLPKPAMSFMDGRGDLNGSGFLNHDGSRTNLFYYTKRIIRELKAFSKVQLKYTFKNSYIITEKGKTVKDFEHTALAYDDKNCPISVQIDKGVAIVTELENGDDRLYMVENIGNIKDELFNGAKPMQLKMRFPEGNKRFYFRGKEVFLTAENGEYTHSLKVGDALFVEIKK